VSKWKSLKALILLGTMIVIIPIAGWEAIEYTSTDDFCTKCHVMKDYRETASHTAHRNPQVNCKDCHIPQDNVVRMIAYKGYSGAKDIYSNVMGPPDIIHTTTMSKGIIQANCIRCHSATVETIAKTDGKRCFECHRAIPHGK